MALPLGNQNLVENLVTPRIIRPKGYFKALALDVAAVLAAFFMSYAFKLYLAEQASLTLVISILGLWALISILRTLTTRTLGRRALVALLQTAALLVIFLGIPLQFLLLIAAGVFIFLFWGEASAFTELTQSLEVRFFRTTRAHVNRLVTAAIIFTLFIYIATNSQNLFVSEKSFTKVYGLTAEAVKNSYPDLRLDSTFRTFAESVARRELAKRPEYAELNTPMKEAALAKATDESMAQIRETLKLSAGGDEQMSSVFYNFFRSTMEGWQKTFGKAFVAIWVIILFLILKGFGTLFYLGVGLIGYLLYQGLIVLNVIHIIGESRSREVIEFT